MERLTQRIDGYLNIWGRTALYEAVERPGAYLNNAIVRLAAYEDTGLTPEEVMALATAEEKRKTRLANMQVGKTLGGVLKNDGWGEIEAFSDCFFVDKKNPRVEVEIMPAAQ